jgi:hypothetical protein
MPLDVFSDYRTLVGPAPLPRQAAPALGQTTSGGGNAIGWIILLGVVGVGGWWLYSHYKASGEGWYVKLYNYPRGNAERRLKATEGPYETKQEAQSVATEKEDDWYPVVSYNETNPLVE